MPKVVDPRLKVAVAQAALKEDHTVAEIARAYHVSRHQVEAWKKEALDILTAGFCEIHATKPFCQQRLVDELYCKWSQRDIVSWLTRTQHSFASDAAAGSIVLIRSQKTAAPGRVGLNFNEKDKQSSSNRSNRARGAQRSAQHTPNC